MKRASEGTVRNRLGLGAACCMIVASLILAAWGCQAQVDEGTGSKTNWYQLCEFDNDCTSENSCLCGVCTRSCGSETCGESATCLNSSSELALAACRSTRVPVDDGMCVPKCGAEKHCPLGTLCVDEVCLRANSEVCEGAAKIEFLNEAPLFARQGSYVSETLYLPVAYSELPEDFEDTAAPAELVVSLLDKEGSPVPHCKVSLLAGHGHGQALSETGQTDAAGRMSVRWIAGERPEQEIFAAILNEAGEALGTTARAQVFAHDEEPQAEQPEAQPIVRPTSVSVTWPIFEEVSALRATMSPITFPHHGFYAAFSVPGLYAGLQNTSSENDMNAVAPDDRKLIVSVWNTANFAAELVHQENDVTCQEHTDGEGGIQCFAGDAWEGDEPRYLQLSWQLLSEGEEGQGPNAEATPPCASDAGCIDYFVRLFATAEPAAIAQVILGLRHPQRIHPSGNDTFVQPYLTLDEQTSCLRTPSYEARFFLQMQTAGVWMPVSGVQARARYAPWHNEVCANLSVFRERESFVIRTGGEQLDGVAAYPGSYFSPQSR